MGHVNYKLEGDVAVITLDSPPVNALNAALRHGLRDALRQFRDDADARAAVLIGAHGRFVPGADIRELGQNNDAPSVNAMVAEMAGAGKPIVAALQAHALGGGLELALGAHYRVAAPETKLGLPEVNIGLLPGGGGTQRLPRVIGPHKALDMMLSGKPVSETQALEIGLVDAVLAGDFLTEAIGFARRMLNAATPVARADKTAGFDSAYFAQVREKNARKWRGLLAPALIVDCVEKSLSPFIAEGLAFEAEAFGRCLRSPQRAALVHVFNAERAAAKIPGLEGVQPLAIRSSAVVGAGTMGSGIAMTFANAGIPVVMLDATQEGLDRGLMLIRRAYEASVKRGSLSAAKTETALSLVSTSLDYAAARDCDIVVEAAFEDMALKKEIFARLDKLMKPGAVLATNTSTLDIDAIAESTSRPEAVVGTHFFSPAHIMKLQENVRGSKTSPEVVATVMALAKRLGKVAVLAGNRDGFIGNRILAAYSRECDFLLEEGATPWQVDKALQGFGFPMGLYLMRDMAGLDVSWRIRQYREAFRDKSQRYSTIADRLCEMGRFGQKTGKGYYLYEGQGADAKATPDPQVQALIESIAAQAGIERRRVSDEDIVQRVLATMAAEGVRILAEGVALRAGDIDVTYVHGYGFPRHEGGPMYWAETQGRRGA